MNVLEAMIENRNCQNIIIKTGTNELCVKHNGQIINIPNNLILMKRTSCVTTVGLESCIIEYIERRN